MAYPAWGEEESKKPPVAPPGKCLQRAPPARGAECRCEPRALLAGRGSAAAAAAALQALPDFCPNRLPKPPGLRQANASSALRRRAGLDAGASCARCLRAAEVLLLPLVRRKPYLTFDPTDCGAFLPREASLELQIGCSRCFRLSPSSLL